MGKTFISYRRKDWAFAQQIAESLRAKIKNGEVFFDVTSISGRAEADFKRIITQEIEDCELFIVIVSERTFEEARIFEKDDFLHYEVSLALQRNKPIALTILEDSMVPRQSQLPEDIHGITTKQGFKFYPSYFNAAMTDLINHCHSIAPQAFDLRTDSDPHPITVAMREQTGIVATFANLDTCRDEMIADFKKSMNVRLLLQIGRKELGGGVASYFFDTARRKRDPNCSIRVLHASKESPFLSRERAMIRMKNKGDDDEEPTPADEWYDGIEQLQKQIEAIKSRGVNIQRREHHEPYLWRIFLFDDTAYVSGYFYSRGNDGKGGIHKIVLTPNSLFKIFDSYFEYLWKKYDPSEEDVHPNEKWKYWGS